MSRDFSLTQDQRRRCRERLKISCSQFLAILGTLPSFNRAAQGCAPPLPRWKLMGCVALYRCTTRSEEIAMANRTETFSGSPALTSC